jgi:GNAT superfamily N-acetyltransferase
LRSPELRRAGTSPEAKAAIEGIFGYTHEGTGWRTVMNDYSSYTYRDRAQFDGTIQDADGNVVGRVQRTVKYHANGKIEVHHDYLAMNPEYQGQGFADAYYKHLYENYERLAVTDVTIDANIDVGGYAWAQRGFTWASGRPTRTQLYRMSTRLAGLLRRDDLSEAQKDEIRKLQARINGSPTMKPQEIANSLRHITWETTTRGGKTITMWPGKAAMLGTRWNGRFRTGVRPQTRS